MNFYKKDHVSRCYTQGGKKRFMQWFNSDKHEMFGIPEVALCDELFLNDEEDFQHKIDEINSLNIGETCIVENDVCIITRVK
jgi:hypothetical protein